MAKLLLVDSRQHTCTSWKAALEGRGHEVSVAANGSLVLTMMERNRPQVIVSHAALEDMSGSELCGIVRADPMTSEIRLILLTDDGFARSEVSALTHIDSTLPESVSPVCLVKRVEEVLLEAALAGGVNGEPTVQGSGGEGCDWVLASGAIQGSLDVLDLSDVIRVVSDAGKGGWLVVCLSGAKGAIAFDRGRPVHAAFGGQFGNQAFIGLGSAAVTARGATFTLYPGGPKAPSTITGNVEELIRNLILTLDQAQRTRQTAPPTDS